MLRWARTAFLPCLAIGALVGGWLVALCLEGPQPSRSIIPVQGPGPESPPMSGIDPRGSTLGPRSLESERAIVPEVERNEENLARDAGPVLRVLDNEGQPLVGAAVYLEYTSHDPVLTDAVGEVEIARLLSSSTSIEVSAEGYRTLHLETAGAYLQPSPWVVRLEPEDPTVPLRGRVVDDLGRAIPRARLTARALGGEYLGDFVETDAQGEFELPVALPEGRARRIRVFVSRHGHFEHHAGPYDVALPPSKPLTELTIQMTPMAHAVDGLVLDAEGGGLVGARVRLRGLGVQVLDEVTTDGTGFFAWRGLDPERVRSLAVIHAGFEDALYEFQPTETRRGVRITLHPKAPEPEVSSGNPASEAWIGSPIFDPDALETLEFDDWGSLRSESTGDPRRLHPR